MSKPPCRTTSSRPKTGWFDVTGRRAVWGGGQLGKVRLAYRLLKGVAVVQIKVCLEIELYIVRSRREMASSSSTAVANNAKDTQEAFMNVKTDPTLRYPAKLPAWTADRRLRRPYIFCGVPRFNRRLFEIKLPNPSPLILPCWRSGRPGQHYTLSLYSRGLDGPSRCLVSEEVAEARTFNRFPRY